MTTDKQSVLADRYELNEPLGTGGMAEVHLGRDRVLGRTIAVKTLLKQFASDPSFIARFRREAQSAASLNHPQIVGVYDTGSDNGTYYIVMEYVEGKTLRELIREEGPLLPERAAEIAGDVCAALSFAHQHGIVHRDVKPANIMLNKQGGVKVTDFGIARAMTGDTVTQTAAVLGTAQYLSPEQAQAAPVDARSDIYSLGVVLYEMLTRQVPFTGSSPVAIAYKHVKEDPIPPSRLNPDVPPALEAIAMKALAKNPDNRYQSAQDMRADLQRAIQGRPVSAEPVLMPPIDQTGIVQPASDETMMISRTPIVDQRARERKRGFGIALLALLLLAIIGVLIWALTGIGGDDVKTVTVPDVVGRKLEEATGMLRARGLQADVVSAPSDEYEAGVVAAQRPEPSAKVAEDTKVLLTVSTGPELATVPDLTGKTRAEAEKLVSDAGLTLNVVGEEPSATVKRGAVMSQNPRSGARVKPGSAVDVTLSSGKQTAIVPDVVGRQEDDARFALEQRGFKVTVVREESSPSCPFTPGRVCKQNPEAGKTVDFGSTVTITVAQEPAAPPPEPSPSPSPTGSPSPVAPAAQPPSSPKAKPPGSGSPSPGE